MCRTMCMHFRRGIKIANRLFGMAGVIDVSGDVGLACCYCCCSRIVLVVVVLVPADDSNCKLLLSLLVLLLLVGVCVVVVGEVVVVRAGLCVTAGTTMSSTAAGSKDSGAIGDAGSTAAARNQVPCNNNNNNNNKVPGRSLEKGVTKAFSSTSSSSSSESRSSGASDASTVGDPTELAALWELVPLDDNGNHTSVGSMNHRISECSPCVFHVKRTCVLGLRCNYCHFPHVIDKARLRRAFRKVGSDAFRSPRA
ncbi:unnamed protein product [Polarella glacialis]|uniref:C3H1-type domain-containing protein n=1 Tax=Polarella glacialis TaxID=89957 RepID=A0A813J2X1_POLGL|nr:unnamed protein product [Polarella glacialis]